MKQCLTTESEMPLLHPSGTVEGCNQLFLTSDVIKGCNVMDSVVYSTSNEVEYNDAPFLPELSSSVLLAINSLERRPLFIQNHKKKIYLWGLTSFARVIEGITVQLFFCLLFIVNGFLSLYGYLANIGEVIPFSFSVVLIAVAEHSLIFISEGKRYFGPVSYRHIVFIVVFSLLLALVLELFALTLWCTTGSVVGALIALLAAALMFYPRFRQLQQALRRRVSLDRCRYRDDGFDLDLTFVDQTVVAMSWPAGNFERLFRNAAEDVERLLDLKYGPYGYHVFNLCSEREYNNSELFHGNFSCYAMDDHNPAELDKMLSFAREAGNFIRKDPEHRAIVVHCKGGKGRTGTMICAYLMYSGLIPTADGALEHFGSVRTATGGKFQGVQTPSQERYVRYFEKLLTILRSPFSMKLNSQPKRIVQMFLLNIPSLWWKGGIGKLWFVIILKPSTERHVIYNSNPTINFNTKLKENYTKHIWNQLNDLCTSTEDTFYSESQKVDSLEQLNLCHDTFLVNVNNQHINSSIFDHQHSGTASIGKDDLQVNLETLQLQKISPIVDDVVIKFYYAKKNPNSLNPSVQLWFHTAMEGKEICLEKSQLDGPHKDTKGICFPNNFTVILRLEEVQK